MTKNILLILFLVLTISGNNYSFAKEYVPYDYKKSFIQQKNDEYQVQLRHIEKSVHNLWKHALVYPVRFDTKKDEEQAKKDVLVLYRVLEELRKNNLDNYGLNLLQARVTRMAHNFDYPFMAEKSNELYAKVLKQNNEMDIRYEYGIFLLNIGWIDKAEKEFNTVLKSGNKHALFSLGTLYIQKDKEQAKKYFNEYLQYNPNHQESKNILNAIENNRVLNCTIPLNGKGQENCNPEKIQPSKVRKQILEN